MSRRARDISGEWRIVPEVRNADAVMGTGFRICDVGELQFFIDPEDLRRRNFGLVEAQMQGG
jgi:hypothetical protein